MSRIEKALMNKGLITFLVAGDPSISATIEYIDSLIDAGVSIIEIGIPFSDPIAEGQAVMEADLRVLSNGVTTDDIFDMMEIVKNKHPEFPFCFVTYINPVFAYGYEKFFERARKIGLDGIIIPDLPFEESDEVLKYTKNCDIDLIRIIVPSSPKRIKNIVKKARGFVNVVLPSDEGKTQDDFVKDLDNIISQIRQYSDIAIAVGPRKSDFGVACKIASRIDGIVVDEIVEIIAKQENVNQTISNYCKEMKQLISKD